MKLTLYRHHGKDETFKRLGKLQLPFHELIICLRGDVYYEVNDETIHLQDRDMLYVPQGSLRGRRATPERVDYISIHFLVDEPLPLPVKIPQGVRSCIPALIISADQIWNEFFPNAEPIIEKLVDGILKYTQEYLSKGTFSPLVMDLRRYMLANLHKKLKVEDIASQMLLSASYCNNVFKRETGVPLIHYLTDLRMQEAKQQLVSNQYTLKEIASNVGFDDYNLFARSFKKHFGITPLQCRMGGL